MIVSGPDHAVLPFGSTNGTPATFIVVATGQPPLAYRWVRIEQRLNFAGQVTSTVTREYPAEKEAAIIVTDWPLTTGSRVRYYVIVTDATGSRTSPQAAVTFAAAPPPPAAPVIEGDLATGYQRPEGEPLVLSVAARGNPAPTYRWTHQGIIVPDATNSSVVFDKVALADQGRWQVTVSNPLGSATSRIAEVLVTPLIQFTGLRFGVVTVDLAQQPTTNTTCASPTATQLGGHTLALHTLALHTTGGQPPFNSAGDWEIVFLADGTYAVPASSMTLRSGTWTLRPPASGIVELLLNSFYPDGTTATLSLLTTCYCELNKPGVAANQHGDWRLGGSEPVVTVTPPVRGFTFGLSATTAGGGALAYQWFKDGGLIPSATADTFSLPAATADDAGTYTCQVTRTDGRSRLSPPGQLVVLGGTSPPLGFTLENGRLKLARPPGTVLQSTPSLLDQEWRTLDLDSGDAVPTDGSGNFFRWSRP